jgi:hypothetical protein
MDWSSALWRSPPWDHAAVAAWFIGAVGRRVPSSSIDVYDRELTRGESGVFRKRRKYVGRVFVIPGWRFSKGSTTGGPLGYDGPFMYSDVVITGQGQVLSSPRGEQGGLNVKALIEMACMTGVRALPPRPSRPR